MEISEKLLRQFKLSVGDLQDGNVVEDAYYKTFLEMAIMDLSTDDISEEVLIEYGTPAIILSATELMNKKDITENKTISLWRTKLSAITKGDRYKDNDENLYNNESRAKL